MDPPMTGFWSARPSAIESPTARQLPSVRSIPMGGGRLRRLLQGLAFIAAAIGNAAAQDFPTRPIIIVVPAPAGGPGDVATRLLAEPMRAALGQPVIIENVAGANGTLGTARASRAAPDGYTLLLGNWNSHMAASAFYPVQYDVT